MEKPSPRRGALFTAFLVVLIDLLGFGIVLPLLPFYGKQFDASPLVIGLLYSSYSAMQFVFAPLWGSLSDRIGRRPVMMISTLGTSLSYVLFAFSGSLVTLFTSRIFAGVMGGNISAAQAYVADVTSEKDRVKGMGLIGAAFGIGFALGPALAAALLAMNPDKHQLPGLAAAALSFTSFFLVIWKLPESLPPDAREAASAAQKRPHPFTPAFWSFLGDQSSSGARIRTLLVSTLLVITSYASIYSAFPLYCVSRFQMTAAQVGGLFGALGFVAVLIQGGLLRRMSGKVAEEKLFLVGTVLMMAGFIAIPLAPTKPLLTAALMLLAAGGSLNGPSLTSLISKEADPKRMGAALGVSQSMAGLGRVIGPSWGGFLFGISEPLPFWTTAVLLLGVVAIAARLARKPASL